MKVRKSSRVILLNDRDEVCLFLTVEGGKRFWITPGGGVDPGESWEVAAIRELWEETGLRDVVLGPCVWTRGVERYFLARVPDVEVSNANQLDYERAVYHEVRWWPVDAIRASGETFYPDGLADLLAPVISGPLPTEPVPLRE